MDLGYALRALDETPVPAGELPGVRQIHLTRHAVERYRERVRADLELSAAAGRLRAELTRRGRVEPRVPAWALGGAAGEAAAVLPSAGAVLPLQRDGERWVAVSCLVR